MNTAEQLGEERPPRSAYPSRQSSARGPAAPHPCPLVLCGIHPLATPVDVQARRGRECHSHSHKQEIELNKAAGSELWENGEQVFM